MKTATESKAVGAVMKTREEVEAALEMIQLQYAKATFYNHRTEGMIEALKFVLCEDKGK